ncbi:MAG: sulfurtransferase [Chloroflexi bacterium CFX1]|nr:sulfurtransferase [Chloroflexi bacterium CFX1]MDL1919277.1 sulfurtransferase [Chloroflexi bacterium CFX5]
MANIVVPYSLVSAQWLKENLRAENLIVLDASMKPVGNVVASQAVAYIPGSLRFDFDNDIREHNTPLPHMMPTPEFFAEEMRKLGVNKDSAIVAYDNVGVYASPRAWWMFRAMGHDNAAVLDGGLPAWMNAGYETSSTLAASSLRGDFASHPRPELIVDSQAVLHALGDSAYSVVDARSAGRFTGQEKEPREGLRGGHMPGAVNLPFSETQVNGAMKAPSLLREMFAPYQNKKLIFSCGSGVTACILALAAEQAGLSDLAVYDGSWAEWGLPSSGLPVVEG